MDERSKLLSNALGFMFPLIIIFGVYMILNGHVSPGGGFQGGTILASVFICRYLIDSADSISLKKIQAAEKTALFFIIFLAVGYVGIFLNARMDPMHVYYFYVMNCLIGLEVACGMTILFYRFVLYESR